MLEKYNTNNKTVELIIKNRDESYYSVFIDKKFLSKVLKSNYNWHVQWNESAKRFYCHATKYLGKENGRVKYKNITLHSFLFSRNGELVIDHLDGNGLNNVETNIREVSESKNQRNRKSKNSNNTSGYRNVSWIKGYWRIQLQVNGKNKLFPEKFEDVHEAGRFAKEMRKKHYGKYSEKD